MLRTSLVGLAIATSGATTNASQTVNAYLNGNDLLLICTTPQNITGCVGYVVGVADAMADRHTVDGHRGCVPPQVASGQLVDITVNYLKQHPAQRQFLGAQLIADAIAEAFPCSSN